MIVPSTAIASRGAALDAILPFDRRDQLAALLTDDDLATLKHPPVRAWAKIRSRSSAIQAWCRLATGAPSPGLRRNRCPRNSLPITCGIRLSARRTLPTACRRRSAAGLRALRPHAPGTVRRRLTTWSILTRWRGLTGAFGAPSLESALRLAVLASARPRQRKSRKAVTGDVLAKLLEACASDRLVDVRHRALFLTAFASGGRPRSEVAGLRVDDLVDDDPVLGDPAGSWPKIRLSDRGGKPRREAMQQSLHKSVTQAATYYNNAERKQGRAARLLV